MSSMNNIGFYAEHAFGLYDIKPLVEKCLEENANVYIITSVKYKDIASSYLNVPFTNILFIEDIRNYLLSYATNWFRVLCVRDDFSEFYLQRKGIKFSRKSILISKFLFFLKVSNKDINKSYRKFISFLYSSRLFKPIDLRLDKLYVVTKVFHPYLLTPFKDVTELIIESWDHPAKEPFLVDPKIAYGWNKDLNEELRVYQSYDNLSILKPLKFRYIEEFNKSYNPNVLKDRELMDIDYVKNNKVIVYPMCTSSTYFAFKGELEFVKDLAQRISEGGYKLYIRPYPLAPYRDIEELENIKNVYVGLGNIIQNGKEVFDDCHMLHKYLLIKHVNYVINIGTTFVFDAALVESECKIIQIVIPKKSYGNFGKYSHGVHIEKYLHTNECIEFDKFDVKNIKDDYKDYLSDWLSL